MSSGGQHTGRASAPVRAGAHGGVTADLSVRAAGSATEWSQLRQPERQGTALAGAQLDAFREIRTLMLSMAEAKGLTHFTTLVVGNVRGAGASFVARNLAAAFAREEGRFAVLVDCNYRDPSQHRELGFEDQPGLFDYLDRKQPALNMLSTAHSGLYLIPAGYSDSVHEEYFSTQLAGDVLRALRRPRCYVVLDGPFTKGSPDARILSSLADFVILVTGYGTDTADGISKAVTLFDPEKFAGVVFNERA